MNVELDSIGRPANREFISQAALFRSLRWRLLINAGTLLMGNSRVRLFTMLACSAVIWAFVYLGSKWGFGLLYDNDISSGGIVELLFDAMFFTLGVMLIFSAGLILYAGLFTGAETRFLLCTPARADQIFAMKFQSAVAFSSWGFLVLGGPILIAYGVVFQVPFSFYLLLPVFFVGYVLLPGAAGAFISLLVVNFFPHRRKQALAVLATLIIGIGVYWIYEIVVATKEGQGNRDAVQGVFNMFSLATSTLAPSHWVSRGLITAARGEWGESLYYLTLLWANGLFSYVLVAWAAKRLYRRGFNRMATGGDLRRRYGSHWLDRAMNALVFYLDEKTRLLIIKDFRTFRREPAQMGQLILFAALLILCVANSRQFFKADIPVAYQFGLSLLNLSATGLLMAAYLGRFIYPLISLEGRKFWILGLLPLRREQILWGKFAFAVTGTVIFGCGMVLMSDLVLGMPVFAVFLHLGTVVVLVVGLSGLSVGLSAWMPNFRETDPSKIVLGFGGTLNMILCLLYLAVIIGLMVLPYHLAVGRDSLLQTDGGLPPLGYAAMVVGVLFGLVAAYLPMKFGVRTLRKIEF